MLRTETARRWPTALLALLALVVLARPRRVVVEGTSMTPALDPGDRLLVCRPVLGFPSLRPGAFVAVRDPRRPERTMVKRLVARRGMWLHSAEARAGGAVPSLPEAAHGEGVVVLGDNAAASTDSRDLGVLPAHLLLGRAVYRYAPVERAGILTF